MRELGQRARTNSRTDTMRTALHRTLSNTVVCTLLGSIAIGAQELSPQAAELRARLQERVESNEASPLMPDLSRALAELDSTWRALSIRERTAARRRGGQAVRHGLVKPSAPRLFYYLNPAVERPPVIVEELPQLPLTTIIETISQFGNELEQRGIELWVAPIPTRPMVYPDILAATAVGPDFEGFAPGFTRFQIALLDAGLEVVDLLAPLARARVADPFAPSEEQVFLLDDPHWSPIGASIAADAVTDCLIARDWYSRPDAHRPSTQLIQVETDALTCRTDGNKKTAGHFVYQRVVDREGAPVPNSDKSSPIVLIGDSFSTIFTPEDADFARHLQHRLGFPLDVIASPAGGSITSRRTFLRRAASTEGKRAVLWMFTIRALLDKPTSWRSIPFESAAPSER